jgi:hypothetical protein
MPKLFLLPAATGRRAAIWALFFYACALAALSMYLNGQRLELRDPVFGIRLGELRKRLRENPGAPLVLVLGTSRTLNGLAPAHMSESIDRKGQPRRFTISPLQGQAASVS